MVLALALCAALAAEGDAPVAPLELRPPARFEPPPTEPAERAPPQDQLDEERMVKRIGLTIGGGAVGLALPLLIGWQIDKNQTCRMFSPCDVATSGFVSLLPLTIGLGLELPHWLMGGKAGVGFGLAGALAGYMTAGIVLAFISLGGNEWARRAPIAGAGLMTGLGLFGAVGAMELRHDALNRGYGKEWPLGRMFAEGAVTWLPMALVEAAVVTVGSAMACCSSESTIVASTVMIVGTLANLAGGSFAGWGVHKAMGGHGRWWAGAVGALISASVAGLFVGIHAHAPPQGGIFGGRTVTSIPVVAIASLMAVTGSSVALEWTNEAPAKTDEDEDDIRVRASAGVVNGGGVIGLSGSF
jgi:hypothetical protein